MLRYEKFIKYEDFAKASINDIATEKQLEKSYKFAAYHLETSWLENIEGKNFKLRSLPSEAQFSSVNGFIHEDIDADGNKEIIAGGNFFPFKPQLGRSDASMGILLKHENGDLKLIENARSGLWLTGDIRDMEVIRFKSGEKRLVVSRNNDSATVYAIGSP